MPGMNAGFKTCTGCPTPGKCKMEGRCALATSNNIREKPMQPTPVRG